MAKTLIRVVDDNSAMREAITFLLESEGWNVVSYANAETFLREDAPSIRGCLVLDIKMPGINGLQLQQILNDRGYNLPIIFLTGHGDIEMAVSAIKSGAVDFLQKPLDNERFLKVVADSVAQSEKGYTDLSMNTYEARKLWQTLTDREQEIIRKIASGSLNKDVALHLGISVRTVETHRANSLKKLGLKTVAEINTLLNLIER